MFILLALLITVLAFGFSGLVLWGIGLFIIWAFGISFVWTYWHGLAVAFIIWILGSIFKKKLGGIEIEEKNVKICDLSQENTKKLAELIMMTNDIETLLSGDRVEEAVEGEPRPISCLREDVISQNKKIKKLEEKLSRIRNALN